MGYCVEQPVVNVFLTMELGTLHVTMKKRFVPISERKTHWCARAKDDKKSFGVRDSSALRKKTMK